MKKILATLVASLGLIVCQGCVKQKIAHVPPPVDPIDQKISFDKMTVTIPIGWIKLGEGDGVVVYSSNHKKYKVMMTKENCPNYIVCMLAGISSIQEAGATLESVTGVLSNSGKELVIVSSKDGVKIYSWFISKGDDAYMLACGGEDSPQGKAICKSVHDSMIIK